MQLARPRPRLERPERTARTRHHAGPVEIPPPAPDILPPPSPQPGPPSPPAPAPPPDVIEPPLPGVSEPVHEPIRPIALVRSGSGRGRGWRH